MAMVPPADKTVTGRTAGHRTDHGGVVAPGGRGGADHRSFTTPSARLPNLPRASTKLPLGEVRTRGVERRHVPFAEAFAHRRACVHIEAGAVRIAPRMELAAQPRGDLLQAGPLLVRGGRVVFDRAADAEGFSAGSFQFDSDITDGRHPRAALAVGAGRLLAVACDGRSRHDAGLTLEELSALLVELGAEDALDLDGGGSTSLVTGGRLRNRPRKGWEAPEPGGRPVSTALVLAPR
jgi:hypothetical protein